MSVTMLEQLINPEVMADMISAKLSKKIRVTPFAKIDTTLQGRPGSTITIPAWGYIGPAVDVAEGNACSTTQLSTTKKYATIKKAMKAVELTDEAVLSSYGDAVGETVNQLTLAIADKVDADAMTALYGAQVSFTDTSNKIKYSVIVDAIGKLEEELNSEKVMFVHPDQVKDLRKDSDFISADKYQAGVMLSGEIGMICNTRIVPSKRVVKNSTFYDFCASTADNALEIVESSPSSGEVALATVLPTLPTAEVGDYVLLVETPCYFNPIVKLIGDPEVDNDSAALTIFLKRGVNVETERNTLYRQTIVSVDEFYTAALTDDTKVVLAKIKA